MRATTPPQPAVELIMRYLAAMRSGDRPTGYGFFAEDIVLHVPGRSAAAGVHHGRDAAVRCIESAVAASHGGKVDVELVDMLANQERVVLIVRERFHRADGVVEIRRANVYRFRGETIAEVSVFEANQYEVDALLEREDSNPPESH